VPRAAAGAGEARALRVSVNAARGLAADLGEQ